MEQYVVADTGGSEGRAMDQFKASRYSLNVPRPKNSLTSTSDITLQVLREDGLDWHKMLGTEASLLLILLLFLICIAIWRKMTPSRATELDTPSVKADVLNLQALEPYRQQPFNESGTYHMTMGLRKLDVENWLTVDKNYTTQHRIRNEILADKKNRVLQCLPGSDDACVEVLHLVVDYLTENYSAMYKIVEGDDNTKRIRNTGTGEVFSLEQPFNEIAPLEIAARLVCEDINILKKRSDGGEHHLIASATLFPVGWSVRERIGWPLSWLHGTVPLWQAKIGSSVERFFSRITTAQPMERSTFFVQVAQPEQSLSDILCQLEAWHNADPSKVEAEDILLRRERQTFRRLPKSDAVVFTVKTTIMPLTGLGDNDLLGFAREMNSWPREVATYKGRDLWGECAMEYCKRRLPEGSVEKLFW